MDFADQNDRIGPRCCGCFNQKYGIPLVLTSWTGVSLYFVSLSFIGKSPFYSHLNQAALIVFGVVNVLFAAVCLYGFKVHFANSLLDQYRTYSKLLSCFTTIIVADMLCNFIVYCVQHQNFQDWCIDNSKSQIDQQQTSINGSSVMNSINLIDESTIFNCSKLFEAEVKFSLGMMVVVGFVYAFWAIFISKVSKNFYFAPPSMLANPNMMVQQAIHPPGAGNIDIQQPNMAETLPIENTQAPNMYFANIPPSRDHRVIPVEF